MMSLDELLALDRKPTVSEVLPHVHQYRDLAGNCNGGSLHIVLCDPNWNDSCVEWCVGHARENGDQIGEKLARVLLKMSYTQRRKLNDKFFDGVVW